MRYLAAIATATVLSLSSPMASAIEEPQYAVVRQYDGFEIREYAPYLVAEVVVPGPAEEAGNQGFRILALELVAAPTEIVDRLPECVAAAEAQSTLEALLHFHLERMVGS